MTHPLSPMDRANRRDDLIAAVAGWLLLSPCALLGAYMVYSMAAQGVLR